MLQKNFSMQSKTIIKSLSFMKSKSLKLIKPFSTFDTNIKNFNDSYVEMRSDVKTLPTDKMRQSVLNSIFGDDSFSEDPTMNKLCKVLADLFGKEKVLYVPTGTMGNIVSLSLVAGKENYIIQGARSHLHKTEIGSQKLIGFKPFPITEIDNVDQNFDLENILESFKKEIDIEKFSQQAKVIAFENTHNYNGGKILNTEIISKNVVPKIKSSKIFNHLKIHLDGSRILNAAVELGCDPKKLVEPYDTINVCLSKALGAPCGSVILMNEEDYSKARVIRKNIGGSMRQSGWLAAPALVALEDWRERFEIDHKNSKILAFELNKIKGLKVAEPETNIVNIYLDKNYIKNEDMINIVDVLEKDYKVLVHNFDDNKYIRAVIHHQVNEKQIIYAVECFEKVVRNFIYNKEN
jgi:threonine aldolase